MVNAVIPAVNLLINSFNRAAEFFGMESIMIEPFEKMEKAAVPAFKSIGEVVTEIKGDLGLLEEQTEETKEETKALATSMDIVAASTDKAAGATKRMTESLMELTAKPIQILKPQLAPTFQTMRQGFVNTTALAIQAGNAIKNVFAQSLREAFGELEKGETRFGKFKESMGRMLRDMIIQFTAAAIAAFALAVAVRFALGGAAGIGGIADIFGTMQSVGGFMPNIPMLAEGGIVTGPTLAMIGEGAQSEAVIPLDRLHEFGGGGKVEVVGRISGADILLSNERAQRNRTRQRGF